MAQDSLKRIQLKQFWHTFQQRMDIVNRHLAVNCVRLLDIQRDDKVLEVGFGTGNGLAAAYRCVKGNLNEKKKKAAIIGVSVERRIFLINLKAAF